jgi:hypothetical protein
VRERGREQVGRARWKGWTEQEKTREVQNTAKKNENLDFNERGVEGGGVCAPGELE